MKNSIPTCALFLAATACAAPQQVQDGVPFPGPAISTSKAQVVPDALTLGNNTLTATFTRTGGSLQLASLKSPLNGLDLKWSDPNLFSIFITGQAKPLASSSMKMIGEPKVSDLKTNASAARLSDRLSGQKIGATFEDLATGLHVEWSAIMTDGASYLRQEIKLSVTVKAVPIDRIEMLHAAVPGAKIAGYTDGTPITTEQLFLGLEHPMAQNKLVSRDGWTPAQMAARVFEVPLKDLTGTQVQAQFNFQGGNHRIDVASVALIGADGKELAHDTHDGFSGNSASNNVYTLAVPAGASAASLRVTLGGVKDANDSWGQIVLTGAKAVASTEVICALPRRCPLNPGAEWKVSSAIGVYPKGQMRRAFLGYLERERAHPYRQYWHYNSWFDLNIGRNDNPDPLVRMTEAQCMEVVKIFGEELHDKRGTGLNGFVWDDGWDDWHSLWQFHKGFPNGFAKLKVEAAKQGAGMGAWLSPWGGYGQSHDARVALGRAQGYETNGGGFSLGGPKYRAAFRDTCVKMIKDYNQNYFKFDGIGGGTWATGASVSIAPDLDGLVSVIGDLRKANPDVFINATVGTWASPYWTCFADSIWRQGEDFGGAGQGNARERWITYRDGIIYDRFASKSPLYPLNSIMYHGLVVSPNAGPASMPTPAQNIDSYRHEAQMAAACGSGLGELYVTPLLMSKESWDILADGLKWSRAHRDILRDAHWIGGAPGAGIYGYAAWHPTQGGTAVLRNPTGQPLTFAFDPQAVFELPAGAAQNYVLTPALVPAGMTGVTREASADKPANFTLAPFEVLVLEGREKK